MTHGHRKGEDEPDFEVVVGVMVVLVEGVVVVLKVVVVVLVVVMDVVVLVGVVVVVVVAGQILAGESWNLPSVIWLRRAASAHAVVHSVW